MSSDLRAFSKHAKRAGVSTDDVKLLARKAPDLHADLEAFEAEHLAKDPKQPREARKRESQFLHARWRSNSKRTQVCEGRSGRRPGVELALCKGRRG